MDISRSKLNSCHDAVDAVGGARTVTGDREEACVVHVEF